MDKNNSLHVLRILKNILKNIFLFSDQSIQTRRIDLFLFEFTTSFVLSFFIMVT